MSKYIDADKLKAFKEALADIIVSSQGLCTYDACKERAEQETSVLLATIASLQQEQTEVEKHRINMMAEIERMLSPASLPFVPHEQYVFSYQKVKDFARHFFELGLNARK